MSALPDVVQRVVRVATGHSNNVAITRRAPLTFQSNQLFDVWLDGQHLIAKQFLKEEEWAGAPGREFRSLHLLLPLDIAPRPFFFEPELGPVVLYEYMEGEMWGRYRPSVEELRALASTWALLHTLPRSGLWLANGSDFTPSARVAWFHKLLDDYAAWADAMFPPGQKVVAICRQRIEPIRVALERFEQRLPAHVFCRSDPRFANVIVRPGGRYGFVDWEDAGLRDPALELADLMLHPEQEDLLTEADWQPFIETYAHETGLDYEDLTQHVAEYRTVLALFWIVILMGYGVRRSQSATLAGWQINETPANLRLQRYLSHLLDGSQGRFDPSAYADLLFFPAN